MGTITTISIIVFACILIFVLMALFATNKRNKDNMRKTVETTLTQQGLDTSKIDPTTIDAMVKKLMSQKTADIDGQLVELKTSGTQEQLLQNAEMHIDSQNTIKRGREQTKFFRSNGVNGVLGFTAVIMIGLIVMFAIWWPHLMYYAYIFGAIVLLLLLGMINPSGSTSGMMFVGIMILLLGGAGLLLYFGISEILIEAQLGGYAYSESTGGTNERIS